MSLRPIFINKSKSLRAGWRIAIFVLLQFSVFAGIASILRLALAIPEQILMAVGYVILLGTTFVVLRIVDHRAFRSVGLSFHQRLGLEWAQGVLISVFMISAVFVVEYVSGYAHVTWRGQNLGSIASGLLFMLLAFLWFGFGEELLFRGYGFQTLIEGTNQYIAIIVLSVGFGYAHIINPNVTLLSTVNTVIAGVWLSVAYLKTRTLWFPTALHATWNFFQGYVYSFPVSGLNLGERSLFSLRQTGPDWITGGAYGPEGGILSTLVLVLGTVYIVLSPSIRIGEGVWVLKPQAIPQSESSQLQS